MLLTTAVQAQLNVVNGDFGDLSGLVPGKYGWHEGLPKAWRGSENTYAVYTDKDAKLPTCNPSSLGFLRQNVGVLDKASDVTLMFDVSEPWKTDVVLNVSLLDGNLSQLAAGDFSPGVKQKLVASNVPASTSIIIAFQAVKATPGLGNVSVSVKKTTSAIPATPPPVESGSRVTVACLLFW